jgi:tetratricopeptide (TPR) repeat protein
VIPWRLQVTGLEHLGRFRFVVVPFVMTACAGLTQLEAARDAQAEGDEARSQAMYKNAEASYRRAVELYEQTPSRDPDEYAEALHSLSRGLNTLCRGDEARDVVLRGERVVSSIKPPHDAKAMFIYQRAWIAAFEGDFALARAEAERALSVTTVRGALREVGSFIADVEEERGNFSEAAKWLARALADTSENGTKAQRQMAFYTLEGQALRLHHAYNISGLASEARSVAASYGIVTARAGRAWPSAGEWVVPAGACGGFEKGDSPYHALDDTPLLAREIGDCLGDWPQGGQVLIKLLFSAEGRVLAAEGAAIDIDRDRLECACLAAMHATLPPAGRGYRSRHVEGVSPGGLQPDYRGM